jgi:hypothetical protein
MANNISVYIKQNGGGFFCIFKVWLLRTHTHKQINEYTLINKSKVYNNVNIN